MFTSIINICASFSASLPTLSIIVLYNFMSTRPELLIIVLFYIFITSETAFFFGVFIWLFVFIVLSVCLFLTFAHFSGCVGWGIFVPSSFIIVIFTDNDLLPLQMYFFLV